MSQPKQNLDRYRNLGGVNNKKSPYLTDLVEFLDLINVDFEIPGSLSKRPGSTQAVGANTSGAITGLFEYKRNDGFSQVLATAETGFYEMSGASYNPLGATYGSPSKYDFVSYNNVAWAANGETMFVYDGASPSSFGLDYFADVGEGSSIRVSGVSGVGSGFTEPIRYAMSYINTRGFIGPIASANVVLTNPWQRPIIEANNGISGGASAIVIDIGNSFTDYENSGITALALFKSIDAYSTINPIYTGDIGTFYLHKILPIGTTIFTDTASSDISLGNTTALTYSFRGNVMLGTSNAVQHFTAIPRYLEVHKNSMFYSGFSSAPSEVVFSDLLQPEKIEAEFFFKVSQDDGDRVTGKKSYQDECLIFKQNSFHRVIGDAPENYELKEVSKDYGCLANDTIIEYKSKLLWLDKRGIVEYNGANWDTISDKIEPIFRRINLDAVEDATAAHYKLRNQIWFGIPVDGSTTNNFTVVFDYEVGAWTFFEGFNPAVFTEAKSGLSLDTMWRGDYSGMIYYHSASFYGDDGSGFTCMIHPEFVAPDGQNVENLFRRLYVDNAVDSSGVTGAIDIEFMKNYDSSTIVHTTQVFQDQFQSRKDFGIMARSMSFKLFHNSASLPLTVHGFGLQRRFLRNV